MPDLKDEKVPDPSGGSDNLDDISWEDAFAEMEAAKPAEPAPTPVAQAATPAPTPAAESYAPPPPPPPRPQPSNVASVMFNPIASEPVAPPPRNLDLILDIPLEISANLGRTKMSIEELLGLAQGSIVELDRMAGEAVEVFVNGKLLAKGEVVVVNEKFGIRLTDILSAKERVKRLAM